MANKKLPKTIYVQWDHSLDDDNPFLCVLCANQDELEAFGNGGERVGVYELKEVVKIEVHTTLTKKPVKN